ncbi:DUF4147 domain-containing protein [Aureimonas sp. ME7]|uniref:glycerate kinase type-2 family protein n=1 Tax=Aureimonas sp. ME7 TaxID=2744252 RepID=UPI0015F4FBCD|nr:DUF4147 domain-containing protein [Aureimonas sp. ME7]
MKDFAQARAEAVRLFKAGVAAADPTESVVRSLRDAPLPPGGRLSLIAVGKAAPAMAKAALSVVEADETLVVTIDGLDAAIPGAEVMAASHPVPDERGERAAREALRRASALGPRDHLLALVSGGASALLPAPLEGLTLADKIAVNRLLLSSGADIRETNLVRQSLSRLKGGGLARAAHPARVVSLVLSDVVGDDLSVVASGPTAPPLGTPAEAAALLRRLHLWDRLPDAVRTHLLRSDRPASAPPVADNRLIGSNTLSLMAMAEASGAARIVAEPLIGDVADAADTVLRHMPEPGGVVLLGGETTVHVVGGGLGGRNQELALRVAALAKERGLAGDWVFLSAGTDGRDGPTDAAGGLVDPGTIARLRAAGVDPSDALARNDSYHALQASRDLIRMAPTGTNVADLQVLIRL